MSTSVGAFTLVRVLGRGSVGEVWEGVHRATSLPVAVKVLTAAAPVEQGRAGAMHRELFTMAQLEHPNLAAVLDFGFVTEPEAAASASLRAGLPYLVMELAELGSLWRRAAAGPLAWVEVRRVLESVLRGLAHAHARGLVHRDLKPENVLVCRDVDGAVVYKLGDFGASGRVGEDRPGLRDPLVGTPAYMAPEQCGGRWRDYAPPTDLYALGCMAYELVAGRLPFLGSSFADLASQHLHEAPPPLVATMPVPEGLSGWIERLLAKSRLDRYLLAADALAALDALGPVRPPSRPVVPARQPPPGEVPSPPSVDEPVPSSRALCRETMASGEHPAAFLGAGGARRERLEGYALPPMPQDWRAGSHGARRVHGATSPRLLALREPPMVGRQAERDRLWRSLFQAVDEGCARAVVIQAPPGFGKSRLAAWLCERAGEVGAANAFHARGTPEGGPADGLGPMVARYMRCLGLAPDETTARVRQLLDLYGVERSWATDALERLVAGVAQGRGNTPPLTFPERAAVVCELIRRTTRWRPCVVWLDDVCFSVEAARLLQMVVSAPTALNAPALFVATLDPGALAAGSEVSRALDEAMVSPRCDTLELGPLSAAETGELVEAVGGQAQTLGAFGSRLGGQPSRVVRVLFERDAATGVAPGEGTDDYLARQVAWLCAGRSAADEQAIELAAVLGRDVDDAEWRGLCRHAGLGDRGDLDTALVERGLAQWIDRGWSWSPAQLREVVLARASARSTRLHRLAAEHLAGVHARMGSAGLLARIGRHWLEAQVVDRALPALLAGAEERDAAGDHSGALALVDQHTELARAAQPPALAEVVSGRVVAVAVLLEMGRLDDATAEADDAYAAAVERGDVRLQGLAQGARALVALRRGNVRQATALARRALELLEGTGGELDLALARLRLGDCLAYGGEHEAAVALYAAARAPLERAGEAKWVAWCDYGFGYALQQGGELAEAAPLLDSAHARYLALGATALAFRVRLALGDQARLAGDLRAARAHYEEVAAYFKAIGDLSHTVTNLNLSLVCFQLGDVERGRRYTEVACEGLEVAPQDHLIGAVEMSLLLYAGFDRDWAAWDEHAARVPRFLELTGVVDRDDATILELAADQAASAGEAGRARAGYELAARLWRRLSDGAREAAVLDKLAAL